MSGLSERVGLTFDELAWLHMATRLAFAAPHSPTAFRVGCVIVDAGGQLLAQGHSRQYDPHDHAEEVALASLAADDPRLPTATLFTSVEPCAARASRPCPCAQLILGTTVQRIVYAWPEPSLFTDGGGARLLAEHGRTVVEVPALAAAARTPNHRLVG